MKKPPLSALPMLLGVLIAASCLHAGNPGLSAAFDGWNVVITLPSGNQLPIRYVVADSSNAELLDPPDMVENQSSMEYNFQFKEGQKLSVRRVIDVSMGSISLTENWSTQDQIPNALFRLQLPFSILNDPQVVISTPKGSLPLNAIESQGGTENFLNQSLEEFTLENVSGTNLRFTFSEPVQFTVIVLKGEEVQPSFYFAPKLEEKLVGEITWKVEIVSPN